MGMQPTERLVTDLYDQGKTARMIVKETGLSEQRVADILHLLPDGRAEMEKRRRKAREGSRALEQAMTAFYRNRSNAHVDHI